MSRTEAAAQIILHLMVIVPLAWLAMLIVDVMGEPAPYWQCLLAVAAGSAITTLAIWAVRKVARR